VIAWLRAEVEEMDAYRRSDSRRMQQLRDGELSLNFRNRMELEYRYSTSRWGNRIDCLLAHLYDPDFRHDGIGVCECGPEYILWQRCYVAAIDSNNRDILRHECFHQIEDEEFSAPHIVVNDSGQYMRRGDNYYGQIAAGFISLAS
jgi:hypothetical protein